MDETVTFNLELNVDKVSKELQGLETLLVRTLSLIRRFGLPEDLERGLFIVQRMITSLRLLQTSITALAAATGGVSYLLAAVGMLTAGVSFAESMQLAGETR